MYEQEKARKIKAKEDAENGKKKIPYILGGGFLLSLPLLLLLLVVYHFLFLIILRNDKYNFIHLAFSFDSYNVAQFSKI